MPQLCACKFKINCIEHCHIDTNPYFLTVRWGACCVQVQLFATLVSQNMTWHKATNPTDSMPCFWVSDLRFWLCVCFCLVPPQPWLDNKHTVFGRCTKGMEAVQRISNAKVNPKTDKPYEDISIINITIKWSRLYILYSHVFFLIQWLNKMNYLLR